MLVLILVVGEIPNINWSTENEGVSVFVYVWLQSQGGSPTRGWGCGSVN